MGRNDLEIAAVADIASLGYSLGNSLIAKGVLRLPAPGVRANFVDTPITAPVQFPVGFAGVREAGSGIARPALHNTIGYLLSAGSLKSCHHLQDTVSPVGAQIIRDYSRACG